MLPFDLHVRRKDNKEPIVVITIDTDLNDTKVFDLK